MCIFSSNNHELIHHSTHDPDGGDSRNSQGYNRRNENVSEMEEDVPMERYEEVEAPTPAATRPKPRPKKAPKEDVGQTRYTRGREASAGVSRPAVARPVTGPAGGASAAPPLPRVDIRVPRLKYYCCM